MRSSRILRTRSPTARKSVLKPRRPMEYGNEAVTSCLSMHGDPAPVFGRVYGRPQICETDGTSGSRLQGSDQLERGRRLEDCRSSRFPGAREMVGTLW